MTKKIEAYIDGAVIDPPDQHTKLIASVVAAPFVDADPVRCVTLVDHQSDKHERVFTESEVRAMMEDVKAIAAEHSRKCYTNRIEQMTPPAPVAFIIDDYLRKKHGITLDPA